MSYPHRDDLYVLPLCWSMSIFSLVLSVLRPSISVPFSGLYKASECTQLVPRNHDHGQPARWEQKLLRPTFTRRFIVWVGMLAAWSLIGCVSCWSGLHEDEQMMSSVENDTILLEMIIFNFTLELLTLNNWVSNQEKSFFVLNVTLWLNCNWIPKLQSHLQNSTWFPI